MKEIIADVLNYSANLAPIEIIKVEGTDDTITVSALDDSKTLILNGTINASEPQLKGVFGLNKLGYLKGLVNFPAFKKEGSKITTKYKDTGVSEQTPESFTFSAADGSKGSYRLMHAAAIPAAPKFSGGDDIWNVTLEADQSMIDSFMQFASLYSGMETNFIIKQEEQDIFVLFGDEDAATHKAKMLFASNVVGNFPTQLAWRIDLFLEVLKLAKNNVATIRLSSQGVLNVVINSDIGEYKYYITGKQA